MNISSFLKPALAGSSFIALLSFSSCNSGSATSGYTTSPNGLDYKIITDNKQPKAKVGDYVQYYSTIRNTKDSVIFSMNSNHVAELGLVAAPIEKGDPIEVLTMLGKGDSVSCLIPVESFFKNIEIPAPLKKGDKLKLDLKIADVFSKDQYDAKVAEIETQKTAAASLPGINYMRDHNLAGIPMPGGMYYVIDKQGTGAQPTTGKKVKVNYSGTLLDGTPFDSSLDPGREPFEFTIGQHQVIQGWDQGIPMFKVGGKGKLIIPPSMGYGEGGQGKIPPNSWLVFDIEVLGVSDPAPDHQTLQMK